MFDDSESVRREAEDGAAVKSVRKIELFDDQRDALEEAQSHLMLGKKVLLQMPTGGGKTVMATRLVQISARHSRVWFVCHLKEIIKQTSNTFSTYGIEHGVIAGKHEQTPEANVQVASVQTLKWRSSRFGDPDVVIWDEAHHIAAKSWAALMAQFPNARHIGLTATPERLDGKGLTDWFDVLVRGPSNKELINLKRLSDFRMFVPSKPDLTNARIQAGDYHKGDIDKVMNTPVLIGDAVDHYKRLADGKRALVFATSIEASRNIVNRFVADGVPADHVDGTTSDDDRRDIVGRLANGELKVVSNVDVFGEGFDLPALDCVILMRPTRSLAKYLQMVGRVLRVDDGKIDTLILDHAGCYYEHGTPDIEWEWSLEGGARKRRIAKLLETGERIGRKCPQCSQVHVESVMVCDCGYEFPNGRDVGEFDGVLKLWRRDTPEGCMLRKTFADYVGASFTAVKRWVERDGMPSIEGVYVPVEAAIRWMDERGRTGNQRPNGDDVVSIAEYSRESGIGVARIKSAIRNHGLTTVGGTWISRDRADEWFSTNHDRFTSPYHSPINNGGKFVSKKKFARIIGTTNIAMIGRWQKEKDGLPSAPNGWVELHAGLEWVKKNASTKYKSYRHDVETETPHRFKIRCGFKADSVLRRLMKEDGFPVTDDGFVIVHDALEWMKENYKDQTVPPFGVDNPTEYEPRKKFAVRIGVGAKTISRWSDKEDGLPCAPNKWVHIPTALEWVRDNTNIEIPPEAWPKKESYDDQND